MLVIKTYHSVMSKPCITVIGSINIDLITRTSRIPAAGETIISQSFDTGHGGKGANQAVACARLSRKKDDELGQVDVRMDGGVGADTFGEELIEGLRANGVTTTGIRRIEGEKTGAAVVIVEEKTGENRILMSPNANYSLAPDAYVELSGQLPSLIVLQLEIPLNTTLQILQTAQRMGVDVLLNPAPAQTLPKEAYSAVTHLIVNESEAAIITSSVDMKPSWTKWGDHFERLIALNVQNIILTLGGAGVIYLNTYEQKTWRFYAEKVDVIDTTAAGDTFVGAYAIAVMANAKTGWHTAAAVEWANTVAAKTVERRGAQSAIPWLDEVPAYWGRCNQAYESFDEWRRR